MTSLPARLLAKVVIFRPGEATTALLMFTYSFLAMTSYNVIKPVTRSKFIASLGADNLPYIQLAAGLLIGVLMHLYSRASGRVSRRWLVPITQALEVVLLVAFWALFQTGAAWVPVAFYVVGLVLGVLLISQFWTFANDFYDPRQAKRLFGFIGGGASLGGATGAGLTRLAVEQVGTDNLLLVGAGLLALCVIVVWAVTSRHMAARDPAAVEEQASVGGREALRLLAESKHLKIISLVIASAAIGAAIIEQQLNMAAEAIKGAEATDAITGLLAEVSFYTSVIGFGVQIGLTSRIHRSLGIGFALLLLPAGLGTTAIVILLNGALWAPAAARVLDTSLRYSLDKTTREVLFLPLPTALKYRAKPMVDVTVDRLAKALGALLLLVLIKPWGLELGWQQLSFASLAVMVFWIGVALVARREYLLSFRRSLGARTMSPGAVRLDVADASTIETLVEELSNPDDASVIYAIDLLETLDRRNLITPLLRHHPSPRVRARALASVGSAGPAVRGRWKTAVEAMLADEDTDVRAAAVRALACVAGEDAERAMLRYLDDPDPRTVVTAAVVLSGSPNPGDVTTAEDALKRLVAGPQSRADARREVAAGLARIDRPDFRPLLLALLQDPDPAVVREAIRSARLRAGRDPLVVPALVALLSDRLHRRDAQDALVAAGPGVVELLGYFLGDTDESAWVRRHLPLTLARIGTQGAMDALAPVLDDADGYLRFKALEAIELLHHADPALQVPRQTVEGFIFREATRFANCLALSHNLLAGDPASGSTLVARALDDKMERMLDRIYRLLGLLYPWKDIAAARFSIERGPSRARASAIEYLDNILAAPLRRRVHPLLDVAAPEDRVRFANSLLRSRPRDLEETIIQLVHDDDQVVSAATMHYVRDRRMTSLADDLEHALAHRPIADRYVFAAAAWVLAAWRAPDARGPHSAEPLPVVELVNRIRDIPLFRGVSVDELFRLLDTARQIGFERGRSLYPSGVLADSVFVLIEGSVVFHQPDGSTRRVMAPTALAVGAVLADRPIDEPIDAAERLIGVRIAKTDFLAAIADSAAFRRALFGMFLADGPDPADWATPARRERPDRAELQPLDKVFLLRAHPLFGRASVDQCLRIVALTREVDIAPETVLLDASAPPAMHLIVSGEVRLETPGLPAVVAGHGHTIGVAEALGGASQGCRAVVTVGGRALYLDSDDLFALFAEDPDLFRSLLGGIIAARRQSAALPVLRG